MSKYRVVKSASLFNIAGPSFSWHIQKQISVKLFGIVELRKEWRNIGYSFFKEEEAIAGISYLLMDDEVVYES